MRLPDVTVLFKPEVDVAKKEEKEGSDAEEDDEESGPEETKG